MSNLKSNELSFSIFSELPVVKVHCSPEEMVVEMIKPFDTTHLYLEHLKNYPGEQNFCKMAVVYFLTSPFIFIMMPFDHVICHFVTDYLF